MVEVQTHMGAIFTSFRTATDAVYAYLQSDFAEVGSEVVSLAGVSNVIGSKHNDLLAGDDGNNILKGAGGMDVLIGVNGHDLLFGNAGSDAFMFEGSGTMVVTTGHGHDVVRIDKGFSGEITVTDFHDGADLFDIAGFGWKEVDGFQDFKHHIERSGANVRIEIDDNVDLLILDARKAQLTDADFHFR
jgi:Ca2+-binding RTX toxin-like protein